jgi:hypothetical protein
MKKTARCWWLMPVILVTQAEIRRIAVGGQPRQKVCKTLSQNTQCKKGLVEWLK